MFDNQDPQRVHDDAFGCGFQDVYLSAYCRFDDMLEPPPSLNGSSGMCQQLTSVPMKRLEMRLFRDVLVNLPG